MKHTHTVRAALEAALPAVEYYHHHEGAEELLNKVQLALSNPDPLLSELVDALDGILQWWMESDGGDDMPAALFDRARAAIAKAKGGAA